MASCGGWTSEGCHGGGVLTQDGTGKRIVFGKRDHAIRSTGDWARIDLSRMEHGTALDTEPNTVPRFIAAADRLHSLLATSNTVTLHCVNGKSRTACALLVFLIRHHAVAYAEAATFVTAMQAERRAREPGFSFDLARQGTTGSYAQWIEAWWRAGRLAVTDANRIHADAWVSVGQRDNKTVYTVQPPPDPLARAPRKRRRSEVEPDPPPSPPRPPPRLRGPTQVDARTVAEGQAWLARMGRNPRP